MSNLDLSELFEVLASLLDQGSEDIAAIGAAALRRHAGSPCTSDPAVLTTNQEITDLLGNTKALPCTAQIAPVINHLSWHYSGYDDGRISADVALRMQTVELIGAHGMVHDDTCRVGLFAQTANTDYVIRTHAAEELFVQICGEAQWFKDGHPYALKSPGDRIHHASYQPHSSRTTQSGLIAVWVWAGELSYHKYKYVGASPNNPE